MYWTWRKIFYFMIKICLNLSNELFCIKVQWRFWTLQMSTFNSLFILCRIYIFKYWSLFTYSFWARRDLLPVRRVSVSIYCKALLPPSTSDCKTNIYFSISNHAKRKANSGFTLKFHCNKKVIHEITIYWRQYCLLLLNT